MFENNIYHGEGLVTVLDYPAIAGNLNQVKIIRAHHHKSKFKIFLFLVVTTQENRFHTIDLVPNILKA